MLMRFISDSTMKTLSGATFSRFHARELELLQAGLIP
jgi:hypothetical protein